MTTATVEAPEKTTTPLAPPSPSHETGCECCTPQRVPLEQDSMHVDLHVHTEYSMLDGGSSIKAIPELLAELGRKAVAITDHGVMNGCPEFYTALKDAGIKPILGCEIYLAEDRFDTKNKKTYHLTLLAETTQGYNNLVKISTYAFLQGSILTFGRTRARADYALLREYAQGIICLTGCMAAPVMSALFAGSITKAREEFETLIDIFGKDNVYGEIQDSGVALGIPADSEVARHLGREPLTEEEAAQLGSDFEAGQVYFHQADANEILVEELCKPLGQPYTATGDVHYLRKDDAQPHDAMICIPTGQMQKQQPRKFSLLPKYYHMRNDQELLDTMGRWPEAFETTLEIAERCNADITFGKELLPRYPLPEGFSGSREFLEFLCNVGMQFRYGDEPGEAHKERLEMELGVIDRMGFNDYFLIVWDLFNEAAKREIPSGPGRGSAAGSIVAYTLGITDLCPIEYDLLFERFLNPGRKSMPDIDMDFAPLTNGGREALIQYATEKYNGLAGCLTAVAQIVTFGKFKAKGALRDAARVLADPTEDGRREALSLGDRLSRYVPAQPPGLNLRDAYKMSPELQKAFKHGGLAKDVIKQAGWLEGKVRTNGIHAAAVIIADHPLEEDIPLQQFPKAGGVMGPLHVQFDMNYSEKIGLLKMDFLGLRNLDVIDDCIRKIEAVRGIKDLREVVKIEERGVEFFYTRYNIPLDDPKTYQLFAEGRTVGTFQFESSGMRESLRLVRPTEFSDLVALVALYRPGSMDYIPEYAARKNGKAFDFLDEGLAPIQGETYGITIYQEQSMQIARQLAGFSQSRADDLRKAIGKKKLDLMESMRPDFFGGIKSAGKPEALAKALWADNVKAADYSFNKSHAACYAYVSYLTGFLKANYPQEYMAALLTSVMSKKDEPRLYLTEAKAMKLRVLPPDLNRSLRDFAVMPDEETGDLDILFPLRMTGVGTGVVDEIRAERTINGPFSSMFDLVRRMPSQVNVKTLQSLVRGGALDVTGDSRKGMFEISEETIKRVRKEHKDAERAFVKAVCERVNPADLDGGGDAEATLFDAGPTPKARKLTKYEKCGIQGAAELAWHDGRTPNEQALLEAVQAALTKEDLRVARADARAQLKELGATSVEHAAGIADEDAGDSKDEKTIVEEIAEAKLAEGSRARVQAAQTLAGPALQAIDAEFSKRAEDAEFDAVMEAETDPDIPAEEWLDLDRLNYEREVLKIYVSGHPLDADAGIWRRYVGAGGGLGEIGEEREGETVYVVGALVGLQQKKMKNGSVWYLGTMEDLSGSRELTLFSSSFEGREELLKVGQVVCCEAVVKEDTFKQSKADDEVDESESDSGGGERAMKLIATKVYRWQPQLVGDGQAAPRAAGGKGSSNGNMPLASGKEATHVPSWAKADGSAPQVQAAVPTPETATVTVPSDASPAEPEARVLVVPLKAEQFVPDVVNKLREICAAHPGPSPIKIGVDGKRYRLQVSMSDKTQVSVQESPEFMTELKALLRP